MKFHNFRDIYAADRYKALHEKCGEPDWIGPTSHLQWNSKGWPIFSFDSYLPEDYQHASGEALFELRDTDPAFLRQVARNPDMPRHLRIIVEEALSLDPNTEDDFVEWLKDNFCRSSDEEENKEQPS